MPRFHTPEAFLLFQFCRVLELIRWCCFLFYLNTKKEKLGVKI